MISTITTKFIVVFLLGIMIGMSNLPETLSRQGLPRKKASVELFLPYSIMLSETDYEDIAEKLASHIEQRRILDEVHLKGLTYVFDAKVVTEDHREYTGVEFLGDRESYIRKEYSLENFTLDGIYDQDDKPVTLQYAPDIKLIKNLTIQLLNT